MEIKNIDEKLKREVEITRPLREYPYEKEISDEMVKAWIAKNNKAKRTKKTIRKFQEYLVNTSYSEFPVLKRLLDEVQKIRDESVYLKFPFSKQLEDFAEAHVRLIYNDGKVVEPLSKHYTGLVRTNMKSISVIAESGKILFTLPIVNDKLLYRLRNIPPPATYQEELAHLAHPDYDYMNLENPKRCFILSTQGKIVFVWDSGEVTEITKWSQINPYNKPQLLEGES